MRKLGYILWLALVAAGFSGLHGATTIKEDAKGIVVFKKADTEALEKPLVFDHLTRDQFYANAQTPDGLLKHIVTDRVVQVVKFLDPGSFPTTFQPDDLAVVKSKLDELKGLVAKYPIAAAPASQQLKYLQNLYDTQSKSYQQSATAAAQTYSAENEKTAFDKKCDLMRLDLFANKTNIQRSEEIVKDMRGLASRSELLTGILAKWDAEKQHALQLSNEGMSLWQQTQKSHPEYFSKVTDVKAFPDFSADFKQKAADLLSRLEQFQSATTFPQLVAYCQAEIPAYFLLTEMSKISDSVKAKQYREASDREVKALNQVGEHQITDAYKPLYVAFKNNAGVIDTFLQSFLQQLEKAKRTEGEAPDREVLVEYQKAYDMVPDAKVAEKIQSLKDKIKNE